MTTIAAISSAERYTRPVIRFLRLNKMLTVGLVMVLAVLVYGYVGPLLVNPDSARIGAYPARQAPSREHILGTQSQGRDVFTVITLGVGQTLKIGLIAGAVGLGVGTLLGLSSGYFSGYVDSFIRGAADVITTIPGLAILIIVASNLQTVTVEILALVAASLAWIYPTRAIRAQTLSLKERGYVNVARLNGVNGLELVVKEILPNLLPYLASSFVGAVSGAMLATIGLEALGLGPQNSFTLGREIYWSQYYGAVLRGMWWWWAPPIAIIVYVFVGLLLVSVGLDQLVNVRLRRSV